MGERQQIMDYFNLAAGTDFLRRSLPRFSLPSTHGALGSFQQWLGQQEAVGSCAQNLKKISSLLTHRAPTGGFYTASLVCSTVAWESTRDKKKVLNASSCVTLTIYREATKCQSS